MHFNYIFYLIFIKYFSRILYNSLYIANEFVFEIVQICNILYTIKKQGDSIYEEK